MVEIAVVVEAEADARLACGLVDQILLAKGPSWIDDQLLPVCRSWSGLEMGSTFTKWTSLEELLRRFPRSRYRRRVAAKPYYAAARKAIILASLLRPQMPNALILMCDLDSQKERKDGLEQAREDEQSLLAIVIATPNPKREAWVLNGFESLNDRELAELESIRQELLFDPRLEAERLRFSSQTSRPERNPKEILSRLTGGDHEREEKCWTETPLATLRERGKETMLKDFLDEIERELLPLFSTRIQ